MEGDSPDALVDIEDLMVSKNKPKEGSSDDVVPAVKMHKKKIVDDDTAAPVNYNGIPGTQTIYLKTWGCAHNSSDSEYMAGLLKEYGYKLTQDPEAADLWVLNSCTVKGPAETHFINEIEKGKKMKKHIVVAGCVPQGAPKTRCLKGLSVIGVHNIDRVVEVVEETLKGHTVRLYSIKRQAGKKLGGAPLQLPKVRRNKFIEIIPISTGCLNQCTYCKTKHARGELGSYPPNEIVDRAKQAFAEGVVEVWITSEDTGAYGRDIGTTLPDLLWAVINVTPQQCKVRLGMTNPPYILDHLQEMAEILAHPKVYKFLHIPVQSGSDAVLAEMKREYTVEDFKHVVDYLKERVPGLTVATDIICGFPTETDEDFQMTMDLCKEYKFPSLFINQFYPRPGTVAAKMKRIPTQEVKKRTKALSEWFQTYQPYTDKLGEYQNILVTETASDNVNYVGHNRYYEQVLIPGNRAHMGKVVRVKITDTKKHCMIGKPIRVVEPVIHDSDDSSPYMSFFIFVSVVTSLFYYYFHLKEIYPRLLERLCYLSPQQ